MMAWPHFRLDLHNSTSTLIEANVRREKVRKTVRASNIMHAVFNYHTLRIGTVKGTSSQLGA